MSPTMSISLWWAKNSFVASIEVARSVADSADLQWTCTFAEKNVTLQCWFSKLNANQKRIRDQNRSEVIKILIISVRKTGYCGKILHNFTVMVFL